ncbi:MAG: hypothetical protein HYR97_01245 [Candidatus Melainabacteria bacterium]|nr:hypothetical protein [Candidatus Melainabacteria bacterium]MBI3308449.1 hypothetical protein [Candidatus Melainabacteria bacterium]
MRVETNRIFPTNESFPWSGIRDFVERNKKFLSQDEYSLFAFDVHDEEGNPVDYHAELGFCRPNRNGIVDIYGEVKSEGTLSTLVLDLETDTGEMTIHNFGVTVNLDENEFISHVPKGSKPEIHQFAEDYTRTFWRVIGTVIDEEGEVQREINQRLASRPILSVLPQFCSKNESWKWN